MPNLLWPFFHDNPRLAKALPAIAAEVIRAQVGVRHGLHLGVIAIPHTFNGRLAFNSHVHTMVTEEGLNKSPDIWASRVYYDRDRLMKAWRKAVIALLRAALRAGPLRTELTASQMDDLLTHLEMLVECQDSILRGQMALPAICRSICKAAPNCPASYHLDWGTNCEVLVQR